MKARIASLPSFDKRIMEVNLVHDSMLLVKVESEFSANLKPQTSKLEPTAGMQIIRKLVALPDLAPLKLIAAVSQDVDMHDRENYIWGVFTRFDCERDVIFTDQKMIGISPVYHGVMGIDATWKEGYPKPLLMTDEIVKRVDERWDSYWQ
jgi:4-hydroxy-3-polyprenylbenzoate decarboxylase